MHAKNDELTQLSANIDLIYQGATDPSQWGKILSSMAGYVDAPVAILNTPMDAPESGGFIYTHNTPAAALAVYPRYVGQNIFTQTACENGFFDKSGVVITCEDILPRSTIEKSVFYQEFLLPFNLAYYMRGVVFGKDAYGFLVTTCGYHNTLQDGKFTEVQCQRHRLMLPHLSRALGVMQRLRDAEFKVASNRATLDLLKTGVLLVGVDGEVIFANRRALCVLSDEDGLRLRHCVGAKAIDILQATDAKAQIEIDCTLRAAISPDILTTQHFAWSVSVPRQSRRVPYALNFSSLSMDNELSTGSDTARAIIFITDVEQSLTLDASWLRATYGLTRAEIRTAMLLVDGAISDDISLFLGISVNTVNSQIKHVYAKTGTHNRAKLVRLLLSLSQTF